MTGKETFKHLHSTLQHIMENSLPFAVVYVMLIEEFLQVPPEK